GALVLVGRRAGDAVPIEVALVLAAGGAYTLAIMLVDDRDLVMSSWSAVADIAGQLLAVGAVLLGRARATAPIADRGGIDRTARWLPAAFAVSALLLQVLTLLHRPHQQPPVESVITLALLGVLAARVGQVGAA